MVVLCLSLFGVVCSLWLLLFVVRCSLFVAGCGSVLVVVVRCLLLVVWCLFFNVCRCCVMIVAVCGCSVFVDCCPFLAVVGGCPRCVVFSLLFVLVWLRVVCC